MSTEKLKVLMCSEASFIKSGFGTYTKEILSRLHRTQKYTIAEFASYGLVNDPRDKEIDWIYYANAVKDGDPRYPEYTSRTDNQFGRWRFEKVLLDFKPDVVIDVRDYWMSAYQKLSPLRKYFHWVLMPTVDSMPQQEEWIETFLGADAVFTYSDWGADVLKQQSSGKIKYIDTASPGVDLTTFKTQNQSDIRSSFNLPTDIFVVGSVMRNQKRKLIPELIKTFRYLIDNLETTNPDMAGKVYLYLHTSYPDAGWDIPELLRQYRLSNKVLFTYFCANCKNIECSVFKGPNRICPKCLNKSLIIPSVSNGISTEQLSKIYNIFDLYVQYAICEGFGMPQVEAGACGIPIITIDYSAMCDIVTKLNAMPVRVNSLFTELETKALRAYPNNQDLYNYIVSYMSLSKEEQQEKRTATRLATEKHYNWDNISKKWENYLDKLDNSGYRAKWNCVPKNVKNIEIKTEDPQYSFENLVSALDNLGMIESISSMDYLDMLKNIDYGFTHNGMQIQPYQMKNMYDHINMHINNTNSTEQVLADGIQFNDDFIKYAKIKANQ